MEIDVTSISSKGQIVIPRNIRKQLRLSEGQSLAVTATKDMIVLRKIDLKMSEDDIKTLSLIQEAWQQIESGKSKRMSKNAFLAELEQW